MSDYFDHSLLLLLILLVMAVAILCRVIFIVRCIMINSFDRGSIILSCNAIMTIQLARR